MVEHGRGCGEGWWGTSGVRLGGRCALKKNRLTIHLICSLLCIFDESRKRKHGEEKEGRGRGEEKGREGRETKGYAVCSTIERKGAVLYFFSA